MGTLGANPDFEHVKYADTFYGFHAVVLVVVTLANIWRRTIG